MICMSNDSTNYFPYIQNFWQHDDMSVADYYTDFNMAVKITEKYGAEFATTI